MTKPATPKPKKATTNNTVDTPSTESAKDSVSNQDELSIMPPTNEVSLPEFIGIWDPSVVYQINDMVMVGSTLYACKSADFKSTTEPPADPTNWKSVVRVEQPTPTVKIQPQVDDEPNSQNPMVNTESKRLDPKDPKYADIIGTPPPPGYQSVEDTAKQLEVSVYTVQELINHSFLRTHVTGVSVVVEIRSVRDYIANYRDNNLAFEAEREKDFKSGLAPDVTINTATTSVARTEQ